MVPEELTNEKLLEQEHIAKKGETRKKKLQKKRTPKKIHNEGVSKCFADLNNFSKSLKTWNPTPKVFINKEEYNHSALSAYKQIYDDKNK